MQWIQQPEPVPEQNQLKFSKHWIQDWVKQYSISLRRPNKCTQRRLNNLNQFTQKRNIEISAPISLEFVLVWNKHVFPRFKMTVFQTYNKKNWIRNVVIWVEILQLHRYTIAVITWLYLKTRMRISKA